MLSEYERGRRDLASEMEAEFCCRESARDVLDWVWGKIPAHDDEPTPPAPDADPKPAAVSAKPARQLLTDKPDAVAARERFTEAALEFEEVARMGTQVGYVEARVAKDRAYDALLATEQGEREGGGE